MFMSLDTIPVHPEFPGTFEKLATFFFKRFIVYAALWGTVSVLGTVIAVRVTLPPVDQPAFIPAVLARDVSNSVLLNWTAPGDDASVGTATSYHVRYSTSGLNEGTWSAATVATGPPTPGVVGTAESFYVDNLPPKTTYYFAVKTVDEAGNTSAISNIASATTGCIESWTHSEWSSCVDGVQTRTVDDLNDCGTVVDRPADSQACYSAPVCQENWTCTEWSACTAGSQSRTCTDSSACGTTVYKPGESQACEESGGETIGIQETYVVAVPSAGTGPQVRVLDKTGTLISQFFAYESGFWGGVNITVGDLGGDGIDEIIVGPGRGREPQVRIYNYRGTLINQFLAFDRTFTGGVNVAVGDIDGSLPAEIIVAPASAAQGTVKVFSYVDGRYQNTLGGYTAYGGSYRGETSVAVGDLDTNGRLEIATVPGELSGGPHVRIFEYTSGQFQEKILGFMAYQTNFRGGVSFATGDTEGDGAADILTAPVTRGGPHVRFFGRRSDGRIGLKSPGYFVFHTDFRGGISIAAGDFDYNGRDEVVAAIRSGDQALVRIFRADGAQIYHEFRAFPTSVRSGIRIATGQFFAAE